MCRSEDLEIKNITISGIFNKDTQTINIPLSLPFYPKKIKVTRLNCVSEVGEQEEDIYYVKTSLPINNDFLTSFAVVNQTIAGYINMFCNDIFQLPQSQSINGVYSFTVTNAIGGSIPENTNLVLSINLQFRSQ